MVLRTFKKIDKKGREEEWSWEETPELAEYIAKQSGKPHLNEPPHKKE